MEKYPEREALERHYKNLPREFAFSSKCSMTLPENLEGKRILDIDCRRGKGVVKLASLAGETGFVLGCDPSSALIEEVHEFLKRMRAERYGEPACEVQLLQGFSENLRACGIEDASFDITFANSNINVGFNRKCILQELARVLRGGGLLILDTVVAESKRDKDIYEKARLLGNVIQAAPYRDELAHELKDLGFCDLHYFEEAPLEIDEGYIDGCKVAIVETSECTCFTKTTVHATKY